MILDSRGVSHDNRQMSTEPVPAESLPTPPGFLKPEAILTLQSMGMPPAVLEYVHTQAGAPTWAFFVMLALWLTSSVALLLGVIFLWRDAPLAGWLIQLGIFPRDTLLIDLQLLTIVFGVCSFCFLIAHCLLSLLLSTHRGLAIRMALLAIQRSANLGSDLWLLNRCVRRMGADSSPEDSLAGFHLASIRILLLVGLWILIPTVLLGAWETFAASYATPLGIRAGGMFAWRRPFVTWDEVQKVSTGASDGKVAETAYVLHYADGSRDLTRWEMPDGKSKNLSVLARIDSELRQRDVPWEVAHYEFGIYQGQPRWSHSAFRKLRAGLSPAEQAVFDRVYRYEP